MNIQYARLVFFFDPAVLESICYRTRANRLINESNTAGWLEKKINIQYARLDVFLRSSCIRGDLPSYESKPTDQREQYDWMTEIKLNGWHEELHGEIQKFISPICLNFPHIYEGLWRLDACLV